MRPDIENDQGSASKEMGDNGLTQILAHVIAEVRGSVNKDINGAELLYGLLNAPWLQSLLKVYECLQKHIKGPARPYLSYSSGLSLQVLSDLLAVPNPSNEARELYALLSQPHLQALLSAHDTVGLRDYEPDLPALPKDLPEDEEAMRIVCLVKNNQPLTRTGRRFQSHWETLRQATHCGLLSAGGRLDGGLDAKLDGPRVGGSKSTETPSIVAPTPAHLCNTFGSCQQSTPLWKQSLSCSTPCVCTSVVIDNLIEDLDSGEEINVGDSAPHTFSQPSPWISSSSCWYHPPPEPSKTTPHARTAPSSPMHCHQLRETITCSHTRLAKKEGLDELRSTLQQATSCMERSSENVHLLGERMAAATERISESVQENSQALTMLTHVVEKLQELVTTDNRNSVSPHSAETASTGVNRMGSRSLSVPTSPAIVSSSRFSHCPPFSSSSSSSSSSSAITLLEQPVLSKRRSLNLKTKPSLSSQRRLVDVQDWMTNGSLTSSPAQNHQGATIRRDDVTGEIYIARVIHGGLADRSGLLHAGDRLVEVNGNPVFGLEPEQIIQILAHSHGTMMFKVVPITDRPVNNQTMLYVRAMVDYNPHGDPSIPCADAGMAFGKGDILEIVDQSDNLWWQAVKLPSTSACAGLIPSTSLLKRKQKEFWWSQPYHPHTCFQTLSTVDEEDDMIAIDEKCVEADEEAFESEELKDEESEFSTNVEGIYLTGFRRSLRLCRRQRGQAFGTSQFCPTSGYSSLANPYVEVVRYQHHPEHTHRLIALMGPSSVGVNELRRRLIEINPKVYQGAVPHTTRPPKCHEESGREYHFISRKQFDTMVCNHRFIEFGELRGHLYGTSVDAIKDVLASGKICVIDIEPNALESVRTPELKAYVIFIKPPTVEQMRHTRMNSHIITNYYTSRPFKEEDFQEIEDAGRKMEQNYCQFFDHVIVNDGLQAACVQLLTAVRRAQDEPQWVPTAWIRSTDLS